MRSILRFVIWEQWQPAPHFSFLHSSIVIFIGNNVETWFFLLIFSMSQFFGSSNPLSHRYPIIYNGNYLKFKKYKLQDETVGIDTIIAVIRFTATNSNDCRSRW